MQNKLLTTVSHFVVSLTILAFAGSAAADARSNEDHSASILGQYTGQGQRLIQSPWGFESTTQPCQVTIRQIRRPLQRSLIQISLTIKDVQVEHTVAHSTFKREYDEKVTSTDRFSTALVFSNSKRSIRNPFSRTTQDSHLTIKDGALTDLQLTYSMADGTFITDQTGGICSNLEPASSAGR